MQTSSRTETSVLFSLRELRQLEHDRIVREAQEVHETELAAIAAKDAAAQRELAAKEAAERAVRDEALRLAQARESAERAARIQVEQTEATERLRHQAELEHARLAQEMELRRAEVAKKRPTWMLVVTAFAMVAAMVLIWFAVQRQHESDTAQEQTNAANREKAEAIAMAQQARARMTQLEGELSVLDGRVAEAMVMVKNAQNTADREAADKHLHQLERDRADARARADEYRRQKELEERRKGVQIDDDCKNAALSKKCMH